MLASLAARRMKEREAMMVPNRGVLGHNDGLFSSHESNNES
jgi:hypothetical protein